MAWTEQDYQEIKARLLAETQGVGDVPNAESLQNVTSLPAYQSADGQNMPKIVRAPLELLAAPAIEAAELANEAATSANEKAQAAQDAAQSANTAAGNVSTAVDNATVATNAANAATAAANQAAIEANKSAENAEGKAQAAQVAADNANDTAEHPTYIGQDHYVYKWNKTTSSYDKTDIYTKGDAFSIKKVYASVAELEADANNTGIAEGDFVLVNTGDVENPDNAKLYVKAKSDAGVYSYEFLVDMSGAIGFTGKTPQFSIGTISTLEAGSSATSTVSEDGVDSDGNPKYKINFAIPRGNPGAPFNPVGQYDTLELLQAAIPDGSGVNGMIAVGTEAPYEYYAWLNGGWVNQGKIAGGGSGNIVAIPFEVVNLSNQSSSAEIFDAFGGKDAFMDICKKVFSGDVVCVISRLFGTDKIEYTSSGIATSYIDENNALLVFSINADGYMTINITVNVTNGLATVDIQTINLVKDSPSDGNTYGRKNQDWVEVPKKSDVLTKTNATEYTPTGDYQPATKKYVDNIGYGKVINGTTEIYNTFNLTGSEAEAKISNLFNSIDAFKQCVKDIQNNHTRYFYTDGSNYIEINAATYILNEDIFELYFIYRHPSPLNLTSKLVSFRIDATNNENAIAIIQNISTDDRLKTMFADISQSPEQNLNDIVGNGIMTNTQNVFATTERNYPIHEAGALFYGTSANGRANQIYGGFSSNRWFARGGGDNNYTAWREFAFKDDIEQKHISSGSINDVTSPGEYIIYSNVSDNPHGNNFTWLKVMGGSDFVQIAIRFSSLEVKLRCKVNGSWSSWKSIVVSDNLSTITKMTTSEYNASSKSSQTAYFVTD